MSGHPRTTEPTHGWISALGLMARHDLRRRWLVVLVTGVLAGLLGGIGLACLAGARRTDTLFERHVAASRGSDLEIDPGSPSPEADRAIHDLPGVTDASYWAVIGAFVLDDQGKIDPNLIGTINFTSDGRYLDQDRLAVSEGRLLDPTRPDEVMLNATYADILGAEVGSQIDIGLSPMGGGGDFPTSDVPTAKVTARVVGIMVFAEELLGASMDDFPKMFVSPAFGHVLDGADPALVGYAWYGVRLENGSDGVDRAVSSWQSAADQHNAALSPSGGTTPDGQPVEGSWLTFVRRTSEVQRTAERAIRPMVLALTIFGGLVLLGTLVVLSQALARSVRQRRDELRTGRVLGMTPAETARTALVAPLLTTAAVIVTAWGIAVALSSRFPVGPFRVLEPEPGLDLDPVVLALGVVALVLLPLAAATWAALRDSRQPLLEEGAAVARGSSLVRFVAGRGAPPPVVSAVRLATEPGRGASFVPVRLVMISSVVTVTLLVATIVFGSNLSTLSREPERFGWRSDSMVMLDGGYGRLDPDHGAVDWLNARTDITGWRMIGADRTTIDGRETPALVLGPEGGSGGQLTPVLVAGRAPARGGEVVLGRRTLDELGIRIGDEATLGSGELTRRVTVTGVAVFPELGPVLALRTRLDDGMWTHPDDAGYFATIAAHGPPYNVLLLDQPTSADSAALFADIPGSPVDPPGDSNDAYTPAVDSFGIIRPVEVDTAASAGRAQSAVVVVVAVAATLSLLFTLIAAVRRRRGDLTTLAVLGFTPRQLRTTVLLQGLLFALVGVAVGAPVGIAIGRVLWRRFADALGVVDVTTVPWAAIALVAAGTVLAGLLSAIWPSGVAARSRLASLRRD